uniref:WAT1-related protein n=1 Tax=Cannabis sativa TaxID=3483 RepID=A0A803PDT2_CANSA
MKVASFYSTIGTLQSALLSALIFERDLNAWKLDLNTTQLLLIVLTASFMGVIRSCVHLWCMRMKGPLYVPMFKPFGVVFATIFGTSLPASTLRYGSRRNNRTSFLWMCVCYCFSFTGVALARLEYKGNIPPKSHEEGEKGKV